MGPESESVASPQCDYYWYEDPIGWRGKQCVLFAGHPGDHIFDPAASPVGRCDWWNSSQPGPAVQCRWPKGHDGMHDFPGPESRLTFLQPADPPGAVFEALTEMELDVLDLLGSVATRVGWVVRQGEDRVVIEQDINELMAPIHVLQKAIMGQAAARAYPGRFRLLGSTIKDPS